ncbi:MAG TPA: crosslink repair DNA glycosylase YcaQ family protein [Candidatus Cloacimonadota bacterium]|nr:crosslink repair DNA glycosylase YcaQ family protein [Candidatus Cloacimonadota bacterium]HPT72208.1 crosslink repair DNA glycosylase YcaQ family protein [Candidatus Cloacimonadota bacterium]
MTSVEIERKTAQQIALHQQLYRFLPLGKKQDVLTLIRELGYVQIDTVSVIIRAHHHTIWTRIPSYQQSWLHELLAQDRSIFEFWGHAASYLPIEDYRYFLPRMKRFPETSPWEKTFWTKHEHLAGAILDRIRTEGPLSATDFEDSRPGKKQSGWWDWKPAKAVLELLMWKGELMVKERRNFQRVYDLTERVLPPHIDTSMPTQEEIGRFYVKAALNAHGISTEWDILNHMHTKEKKNIQLAIKDMLHNREIARVRITGLEKEYYSYPGTLEQVDSIQHPNKLFLLSPFDNLVILRPRIQQLFDFDYTIECYVPQAKRKYGYWSLPMLWKGKFVGRIDLKADRADKKLCIRNLHFEKGIRMGKSLATSLHKTLQDFMKFNQCDSLKWDIKPIDGLTDYLK